MSKNRTEKKGNNPIKKLQHNTNSYKKNQIAHFYKIWARLRRVQMKMRNIHALNIKL